MTRGEIWWADFGQPFGSEPGFLRPVLVVQNDSFNQSTIQTVAVAPLTTNLALENAPGNVYLDATDSGLPKPSVINVSLITALDRRRLTTPVRRLPDWLVHEVEQGLKLVLALS